MRSVILLILFCTSCTGVGLELLNAQSKLGWFVRDNVSWRSSQPTYMLRKYGKRIEGYYPIRTINSDVNRLLIDEVDVDIMVRTVIGESAKESIRGQAAVSWVILTRAAKNVSWYGGNRVSNVALHKSSVRIGNKIKTTWQFEPWMNRRDYLWTIPRYSKLYLETRRLVLSCLDGDILNPTDDATHFLEPSIVISRVGKLPSWASGNGERIGNHVFFRPKKD